MESGIGLVSVILISLCSGAVTAVLSALLTHRNELRRSRQAILRLKGEELHIASTGYFHRRVSYYHYLDERVFTRRMPISDLQKWFETNPRVLNEERHPWSVEIWLSYPSLYFSTLVDLQKEIDDLFYEVDNLSEDLKAQSDPSEWERLHIGYQNKLGTLVDLSQQFTERLGALIRSEGLSV